MLKFNMGKGNSTQTTKPDVASLRKLRYVFPHKISQQSVNKTLFVLLKWTIDLPDVGFSGNYRGSLFA